MSARTNYYRRLVLPILGRLDAEWIHDRAITALAIAQALPPGSTILRSIAGDIPTRPVTLWGLRFPNVLGVAAGFDKDARVALGLALLGFGHIEVGTLTPLPQKGNPRPRIHRIPSHHALINSMGFPNRGVQSALPRLYALSKMERRWVLGVSIGKQKDTPVDNALFDYINVMGYVHRYADYLAVNISSPNTPDLRRLQTPEYVHTLCARLQEENERLGRMEEHGARPLLIKIAPDLSHEELDIIVEAVRKNGLAGIIATNTTLDRVAVADDPLAGQPGGLSGNPLASPSTEIVRYIHTRTAGQLPIIGVGGIESAEDARAKLNAGASLLQLYTGMIYRGPGIAGEILRGL